MPYRFRDGEAVPEGMRRCAGEQLDSAIEQLTTHIAGNPVGAVHSARKALKKERSLLRLGRGAMGARQRRHDNDALQQIARRLGGIRDQDVLVKTFDELARRFAGQVPESSFAAVREALASSGTPGESPVYRSAVIREAVAELESARRRVDEWRFQDGGWSALRGGLIRSYARGRRAFAVARAKPTADNIHEWRKRAKDLWYHLRLLRQAAPDTLRGQAREAHRLSELLGDDHDLSVLSDAVLDVSAGIPADVEAVLGLIQYRRNELQTDAFFLGERLYAESPKAFARRLRRYWKAWRAETRSEHSRPPIELAQLTRA